MIKTYIALIVGSILSVVVGLGVAFPVLGILSLMYANYDGAPGVLLAATSTVIAVTSFCAGFTTAWAAGENREVGHGVLSALLCIAVGLLSLMLVPFLFIPLCIVSPVFGGIGGYCRMVLRLRQNRPAR